MKTLFISDLHLHNYKPFSTVVNGNNSRLLDIKSSIDRAFEIAKEEGCELVVVSGDIFHTRGNLKPSVIAVAKEAFSEKEFPIIMIAGNHDMENYRGGATALEVFKGIPGIKIVEKATWLPVAGGKVSCIPYVHDICEFKATFDKYRPDDETLFSVIHQGIDDFGDAMGIPRTTLTAEFLLAGHNSFVFAGHYHKSATASGRAVQVGAICQHSFSDIGQERGCWVFDTDEKAATFFPISVAPEFIDIKRWSKKTAEMVQGNFVRVTGKTAAAVKKITSKLVDLDVEHVARLDKTFGTAHEKTIGLDLPIKMLSEYIDIQEDLVPLKTDILALYGELSDKVSI